MREVTRSDKVVGGNTSTEPNWASYNRAIDIVEINLNCEKKKPEKEGNILENR